VARLHEALNDETQTRGPEPTLIREIPRDFAPKSQIDLFAQEDQDSIDIPLWDDAAGAGTVESEPGSDAAPTRSMFGATDTATAYEARPAVRRSHGWLLTAILALSLGIIAGFAGGFFVARKQAAAPAVASTPAAREPTKGQTFTDAPVDDVPPVAATTPQPAPPAPAPAQAAPASTPPRPAPRAQRVQPAPPPPSGPAAMQVDSRPSGAQVFVDGRSVGYTPMLLGELPPGTHSVRIQLPGYHPWVTAVTLGAGARERVAASLEP
jgi:hypothetical protein